MRAQCKDSPLGTHEPCLRHAIPRWFFVGYYCRLERQDDRSRATNHSSAEEEQCLALAATRAAMPHGLSAALRSGSGVALILDCGLESESRKPAAPTARALPPPSGAQRTGTLPSQCQSTQLETLRDSRDWASHYFVRGVMGSVAFARGGVLASAGTILSGRVEYHGGGT